MPEGGRLSVVTVAELTLRALGAPAMSDAAGPGTLESDTAGLVAQARAGDVHAFGTLVDRHARAAKRVAAAALATPDDADDVVQEACVTAWQRLGDLRMPEAFRSWLLRITWRKALDRRRSARSGWPGWCPARPPPRGRTSCAIPVRLRKGRPWPASSNARSPSRSRSLPTRLRDPFLLATAHHHRYDDIAEWLRCRWAR